MEYLSAFNWIDLIIAAFIVFFAFEGWRAGSVQLISGLIAYAAAIFVSVRYHSIVATFLRTQLNASGSWSDLIGYAITALVIQIAVSRVLVIILRKAGRHIIATRLDSVLGVIVSVVNISVLLAFIFFLLLRLPVNGDYKYAISRSFFATRLIRLLEAYGGSVTSALDTFAENATEVMMVKPETKEIILLDIKPQQWELSIDSDSERRMLEKVNADRIKTGVVPLSSDAKLTAIAREYSRDMIMKRYFSHVDPEGKDVKDRLIANGVDFAAAGENLAFAPDIEIAYQGLFESESHKRNILDPTFSSTGIGVIDAGIYGKMITQIFASPRYYIFGTR